MRGGRPPVPRHATWCLVSSLGEGQVLSGFEVPNVATGDTRKGPG